MALFGFKKAVRLGIILLTIIPTFLTGQSSTWNLNPIEMKFLGLPIEQIKLSVIEVYSGKKAHLFEAVKSVNRKKTKPTLVITTYLEMCGPCWNIIDTLSRQEVSKKYKVIVLFTGNDTNLNALRYGLSKKSGLSDFHFYALDRSAGIGYIRNYAPDLFFIDKSNELADSYHGFGISVEEIENRLKTLDKGENPSSNNLYYNKLITDPKTAQFMLEKKSLASGVELRKYYIDPKNKKQTLIQIGRYKINGLTVSTMDGPLDSYYSNGAPKEKALIKNDTIERYDMWWVNGTPKFEYRKSGNESYLKAWREKGELFVLQRFLSDTLITTTQYQRGIAYKEENHQQSKTVLLREGYTKLKGIVLNELIEILKTSRTFRNWPILVNESQVMIPENIFRNNPPSKLHIFRWRDIRDIDAKPGLINATVFTAYGAGATYQYPRENQALLPETESYPSQITYQGLVYTRVADKKRASIGFETDVTSTWAAITELFQLYKELQRDGVVTPFQ